MLGLTRQVWDHDPMWETDDFLGETMIPIADAIQHAMEAPKVLSVVAIVNAS